MFGKTSGIMFGKISGIMFGNTHSIIIPPVFEGLQRVSV